MPRVKKYKLIKKKPDGTLYPRPLCGKCKRPTYKATIDRGARTNLVEVPRNPEIGRFCWSDRIFYPHVELTIMGYE